MNQDGGEAEAPRYLRMPKSVDYSDVIIVPRGDGGVTLATVKYGDRPWARRKTRKPFRCCMCMEPIPRGEAAYSTLDQSAMNRLHRACIECVEVKGKEVRE